MCIRYVMLNYYKVIKSLLKVTNPRCIAQCKTLYTLSVLCSNYQENSLFEYKEFENIKEKNKSTYLQMIKIFENQDAHRRGHVEFIYSALKNMKHFGVHKDLEVYKAIIDILPKGKFIPANIFQAQFMHYPKQQQCVVDLLDQMENNGVVPDCEMEDLLLNIFGKQGIPLRKFWRMMYWMPKFKNCSPWPLPNEISNDTFELAKLAIERISSVDIRSRVSIYKTSDIPNSIDNTWIVSAQSETQQNLLNKHDSSHPVFVEGAFKIWIKDKLVNYFMLKTDPNPISQNNIDLDDVSHITVPLFEFVSMENKGDTPLLTVYEQEDGVIFSVCATGTSSRDSLLSWIRHLEEDGNPSLARIPIVFTLFAPHTEVLVETKNKTSNRVIHH